jgi:hypothetical protein
VKALEENEQSVLLKKIRKIINNKLVVGIFLAVTLVLLTGFTIGAVVTAQRVQTATAVNDDAREVYNAVNAKMYAENMVALERSLRGSFSEQQLMRIAQSDIRYGITINGDQIQKNTDIYESKRPTVAVLLSESYGRTVLNLLPSSILEMGSILKLDDAGKLITISYQRGDAVNRLYEFGYGKSLSYEVSDLKPGDIVTIEIAPWLAQKMELENNIIEVFYSRVVEE